MIRDETGNAQNTALRVGGLLVAMLMLLRAEQQANTIDIEALKKAVQTLQDKVGDVDFTAILEELKRLLKLIEGDPAVASAEIDPFIQLGNFETWEAANARLDTLTDARYNGPVRLRIMGANMFVEMHAILFVQKQYVQTIRGKVAVDSGTGRLKSGPYGMYKRESALEDGKVVWSAWKKIFDENTDTRITDNAYTIKDLQRQIDELEPGGGSVTAVAGGLVVPSCYNPFVDLTGLVEEKYGALPKGAIAVGNSLMLSDNVMLCFYHTGLWAEYDLYARKCLRANIFDTTSGFRDTTAARYRTHGACMGRYVHAGKPYIYMINTVGEGQYGIYEINVYDWTTQKLVQVISSETYGKANGLATFHNFAIDEQGTLIYMARLTSVPDNAASKVFVKCRLPSPDEGTEVTRTFNGYGSYAGAYDAEKNTTLNTATPTAAVTRTFKLYTITEQDVKGRRSVYIPLYDDFKNAESRYHISGTSLLYQGSFAKNGAFYLLWTAHTVNKANMAITKYDMANATQDDQGRDLMPVVYYQQCLNPDTIKRYFSEGESLLEINGALAIVITWMHDQGTGDVVLTGEGGLDAANNLVYFK